MTQNDEPCDPSSPSHTMNVNETKAIFRKAQALNQNLDTYSQTSLNELEKTRILLTAELYRLAALIYLIKTSIPRAPRPVNISAISPDLQAVCFYVDEAMNFLRCLETCTSPWPLFVVACESWNDKQRIEILHTLDKMDDRRNIGNILVLRAIIESFWKQQDLRADSGQSSSDLQWWDIIDLQTASPWFI